MYTQKVPIAKTTVDELVARRLAITGKMDRSNLEQAQIGAFNKTLTTVRHHSPFYKERFAHLPLHAIEKRSDLPQIPFLTKEDIIMQGHRLLAVSQSKAARVITLQTSGSTGTPKRLSFSKNDLASTTDFFLHGMLSLITPNDRVLVLLPFTQPASVGELLITALTKAAIHIEGKWPPENEQAMAEIVTQHRISCVVGLPQHLLALSATVPKGKLRSMLLCSDYAAPALRQRIEQNCGCETFLHYGATESGLGGAVECGIHDGCHIRESDLLVEIVDPITGEQCIDGEQGEVVLTTLSHEAMPLIRYRTGDMATLDRTTCGCGGISARLRSIRGRLDGCRLATGAMIYSQDIDDILFNLDGLVDYRIRLDRKKTDRIHVEHQTTDEAADNKLIEMLHQVPAIAQALANGKLQLSEVNQVEHFTATHTIKRTIVDQRSNT